MRILQISSARALGGGERHLVDLANSLAERGHEVHAALAPRSPLREQLALLPAKNLHTLRLRNALDVPSALDLSRLVRRERIQIVHAHMARDYPLAAFATKRHPSARLIVTRHVLFPLSKIHRLALSHVSRVIAVSEAVARSLKAQDIFPDHKIRVVRNGVDRRHFSAGQSSSAREEFCRRLGMAPERRLIGSVGELKPLKGHEDFLRAAAPVARRFPDVDFVIAGEDFSENGAYRASLASLIREQGLAGRVHLLGWVDDVAPMLSALDLFVSASLQESFGLAIAEAMASGLAVVATATEGATEIVEDGVTGKLVPVGAIDALARALTELLENDDLRRGLGARAREAIGRRFSLDEMVAAIEQIYHEALSEAAAR